MSLRPMARGRGTPISCAVVALCLAGCTRPPAVAPTARPKPHALHHGPLTDFVSAAGLRWLVVGRPREIAQTPWLAEPLGSLFPEARVAAFAASTGIDLRTLPNGLIAGFDFGNLYVAEVTSGEARIEERFRARLLNEPIVKSLRPDLRSLQGVMGQTPETLVLVRGQLVAIAVGDPTPARAAIGFATGRLRRSPAALAGSALSTLPRELEQAIVRLYAPGPFEGDWARAGRGILGAALAVGCGLTPDEPDFVKVDLVLSGEFAQHAAEAERALLGGVQDLIESSTGRVLGLADAVEAPTVRVEERMIRLTARVRVSPVLSGLRAVVRGDVWEILDTPPARTPDSAHFPTRK